MNMAAKKGKLVDWVPVIFCPECEANIEVFSSGVVADEALEDRDHAHLDAPRCNKCGARLRRDEMKLIYMGSGEWKLKRVK